MKLKVNRDILISALQKVQSVVASRNALPVLSNALFEADKDQLVLTTTDMSLTVRTTIPAEVAESGATTLPVKRILAIFRELPVDEVEFSVNEKDVAEIRSENSFFRVHGISRADYPTLPDMEGARSYTIAQTTLRDMLRMTSYAASLDATRQMLNAVLLSFNNGKLSVVATDSRRLALVEQELAFPEDAASDLVIPLKTIDELLRILKDDGDVRILATAGQVAFECDGTLIVSKLVDKPFPNFRQVIPQEAGSRVTLDREVFQTALRRTHLLVADATSATRLKLTEDKMEVLTAAEEIGEARETLAVRYNGPDLTVSFNPVFLMDPLKNLSADEVFLDVRDDASPGVIRSTINFIYVLMPIRL